MKRYLVVILLFYIVSINPTAAFSKSVRIGFEGMPGAGKTSSLVSLAEYLPEYCLFLPEVNLQNNSEYETVDVYHELWKERARVINSVGNDYSFIMDRTYFSNVAYTYASNNSRNYAIAKKKIKQDFSDLNFDLIIILITSPEIGLKRRYANNDFPPYPWNKVDFLDKLKNFYINEFPKIYKGKYLYIYTDNMTLEELKKKIITILSSYIEINSFNINSTIKNYDSVKNRMLTFAKNNKLGQPYTGLVSVRGYPTIYYRQHAIQNNENNEVVYLDTLRLNEILINN